jgi:hypothetical protein
MKMRVMTTVDGDGTPTGEISYWLFCPGCKAAHRINNSWDWDGNLETPTFNPSILSILDRPVPDRCHSFIRDGVWDFLSDSTHDLAGQQIPMVDLPDWLASDGTGDV